MDTREVRERGSDGDDGQRGRQKMNPQDNNCHHHHHRHHTSQTGPWEADEVMSTSQGVLSMIQQVVVTNQLPKWRGRFGRTGV